MQHMKISVADTGLQVRVRPGNPDSEMGGGGGGRGAVSKTFLSKNEGGAVLDVPLHLARAKLDPIDLGPVVWKVD